MRKWIAKAVVQKTISFLPAKHRVNYLFQKYITKGVLLSDQHLELKLMHARDHLNFFRKEKAKAFDQSNCIELGSGWYPVVPIALFLNGFKEVLSLDIRPWMTKESFQTCVQRLREWQDAGKLQAFLPHMIPAKWEQLLDLIDSGKELDSLCEAIGLQLVVGDARQTDLKSGSIDYFCSNNTFEHIFPEVLEDILKEFGRLAHQESVMSHFIDLSDHFAHMDASINIYNFLQFSEKQWQRIDNDIQPQNRLRWPDYLKMYDKLNLPAKEALVRPGSIEALSTVPLAEMYKEYAPEELAISHGYLISNFKTS